MVIVRRVKVFIWGMVECGWFLGISSKFGGDSIVMCSYFGESVGNEGGWCKRTRVWGVLFKFW